MRAVLAESELILEGLARLDGFLIQARYAIHAVGQKDAVPMNTGWLWQSVGDVNANAITFYDLNGRARCAAVVSPTFRPQAGREFVVKFLRDQMKYFDSTYQLEGERLDVGCYDGGVVAAGFGRWKRLALG